MARLDSTLDTNAVKSGPPTPRRFSVARTALFSFVPLVVILAAIEGVSRLIPHKDRIATRAGFVVSDPDLGWRLRPTDAGRFATNELGFRDTPYRADADVKILLLGDSVSWADGIADIELTFPYLLERRLQRAHPSMTFEVINTGVPGYSTFQEAAYLKREGFALEPDLVLLQFCLNDVFERYHTVAAYGGDNVFLGVDTREMSGGLTSVMIRHSRAFERLARFLQNRSRRREEYDVNRMARDELSPELEQAWQAVFAEIKDVHRMTTAHGVPLLLMIAPYEFQLGNPRGKRQPQDHLIAFARSAGLEYVDLLPGFAQVPRSALLFNDPSHFSVRGHRRAARLLVEPVERALSLR